MERSIALATVGLLFVSALAHAESMPIPPCNCNDDCTKKWPYSGYCVQNAWGKYCGWSGPGVPCTDGGPAPDLKPDLKEDAWPSYGCGDAMPSCGCNDDCKSFGLAYCVKHPLAGCDPICSSKGPGIVCLKKDVGIEAGRRPCSCNWDCAFLSATPYCAYQSGAFFCSSVGPGHSCPDDAVPRGDDWYPRDSGPGTGASPPPRGGCSLDGEAPSTSASGWLLLGLAFALLRRRRSH